MTDFPDNLGSTHPSSTAVPGRRDIHTESLQQQNSPPQKHQLKKDRDNWEHCLQLVTDYDKDMCNAWKEEIDKLLIFAGLFSAAVTAFAVESYKWLQEDPSETSEKILSKILLQLQGGITSSTTNSEIITFIPSSSAVRTNIFWYLSLTLSLATVLIGILCSQWLREYQRPSGDLSHKEALELRQMRYEGIRVWKVSSILALLPLLLQLSLVLFFIGLLDFLWTLNHRVALPVTIVVSIVGLFVFLTTLLPGLQSLFSWNPASIIAQCPYKSPQSWLVHQLLLRIALLFSAIASSILSSLLWVCGRFAYLIRQPGTVSKLQRCRNSLRLRWKPNRLRFQAWDANWRDYDNRWLHVRRLITGRSIPSNGDMNSYHYHDTFEALAWIRTTFAQSRAAMLSVYFSIKELPISSIVELGSRDCFKHLRLAAINNRNHDYDRVVDITFDRILFMSTPSYSNVATASYTISAISIGPELRVRLFKSFIRGFTDGVLPPDELASTLPIMLGSMTGAYEPVHKALLCMLATELLQTLGKWIQQPVSDSRFANRHLLRDRLQSGMHFLYLCEASTRPILQSGGLFKRHKEGSEPAFGAELCLWSQFVGLVDIVDHIIVAESGGFYSAKITPHLHHGWENVLIFSGRIRALLKDMDNNPSETSGTLPQA
ncbi:hypothetical protein AMATHDRAFT_43138 [Amanita thiersii Skay4041]|uniref:DUF6535 domain-containing protein n=1 Tax=Amanita thiersii Skay4041 TaxID=703135 RepID=A0A2A9NHE2_9AGAR|nr:hypothetical protein AMATHDRAFT_43138 [Amanita thiersii Skay4041]